MAKLNFGGTVENVVTREEFPLERAQEVLANETIAIIGYGVQGPGQALNMRDNGLNIIIGQRAPSKSWDKAIADGFEPGVNLFSIEEACQKGTIIMYLLSDAAQISTWPLVKKYLTPGKALYFSHGFGTSTGNCRCATARSGNSGSLGSCRYQFPGTPSPSRRRRARGSD